MPGRNLQRWNLFVSACCATILIEPYWALCFQMLPVWAELVAPGTIAEDVALGALDVVTSWVVASKLYAVVDGIVVVGVVKGVVWVVVVVLVVVVVVVVVLVVVVSFSRRK